MKRVKEIATELSKGTFGKASDLRRELSRIDNLVDAEIMEIARQAMISNLKGGRVDAAKEIRKSFSLSQDIVDETVEQAVMSSLYEGDMQRVRELKADLPIKKELGDKIIGYCATWGKKERTAALEELFA